jgi:hypothetical protein
MVEQERQERFLPNTAGNSEAQKSKTAGTCPAVIGASPRASIREFGPPRIFAISPVEGEN